MKIEAGKIIEIVYLDRSGKITQRNIEVHGVRDGLIRATDIGSGAPRAFRESNILAWQPTKKGVTAS
ncbi:hypothetical protein [Paenibacillus sp. IHBB 3054]|uniref:hypothetical protein n=1 Tax=Paenibacillus sp. IHBB 3054 TaxID=3425689 RepID=UPI003F67AB03